jgi:hypothetical protein
LLLFVLSRHPERSEGSLYFAFALAVARSHLIASDAEAVK